MGSRDGVAANTIAELEAKIARLERRGITSMAHELETWHEVKSYWEKVSSAAPNNPAALELYRRTPRNLAALLDAALLAGL